MGLDDEFLRKIAALRQADMGTELMGPLLYSLIRSTRPQRLLEVGMGYTTPFILRAIADNSDDAARERQQMIAKCRAAIAQLQTANDAHTANRIFDQWMRSEPALGAPEFHYKKHAPKLHAIDLLSHPMTTAGRVHEAVKAIGLQSFIELHIGDFRGMRRTLAAHDAPFDFVWFDCGGHAEYADFLTEYWDVISENGGVLILHLTLNDFALGCVLRDLKIRQLGNPDKIEILSLAEPHKATQGSFTMVRKIGRYKDPICEPSRLLQDVRRLVEIADAEPK